MLERGAPGCPGLRPGMTQAFGRATDGAAAASAEIERLIQLLARLPGLGPRSARRAALHLVKKKEQLLAPLAAALTEARDRIVTCETCGNIDTVSPCTLCRDQPRDRTLICVVEEVGDLWALERARRAERSLSRARRHAVAARRRRPRGSLHRQADRARRRAEVKEVLLALNATVEGQSTAHYLTDQLPARRHRLAPRAWRADRRRARLSRRRHARRGRQGPQGDVSVPVSLHAAWNPNIPLRIVFYPTGQLDRFVDRRRNWLTRASPIRKLAQS